MTGPYRTRCPHCDAQFRISEEHLAQAQGAVRCGSCLRVFQATEHLLEGPPLIHERDDQDGNPGQAEKRSHQPWATPLPEEIRPQQDNPAVTGTSQEKLELSDSFLSLEKEDPVPDLDLELGNHPNEQADESWAEALLQELEREPAVPPTRPAQTSATAEPVARDEDEEDAFDFLNAPATARSASRQELDTHGRNFNLAATLGWTLLTLLALAVLAGQYLVFHFDHLSRSPQWRPAFTQACQILGCPLPPQADPSRLRGTNLVVRSHPRFDNALVVDALLFNEARWPQPFPQLELTFTDLQGQPVARRLFGAAEYLRGELTGAGAMPSNTPVHISLEIVDPGRRAVSYHLRLLPAGTSPDRRLSDAG